MPTPSTTAPFPQSPAYAQQPPTQGPGPASPWQTQAAALNPAHVEATDQAITHQRLDDYLQHLEQELQHTNSESQQLIECLSCLQLKVRLANTQAHGYQAMQPPQPSLTPFTTLQTCPLNPACFQTIEAPMWQSLATNPQYSQTQRAQIGCDTLTGLATGDMLGAPTESRHYHERYSAFEQWQAAAKTLGAAQPVELIDNPVSLAAKNAGDLAALKTWLRSFGSAHHCTDDSQMAALALVDQLHHQGRIDGDTLSARFIAPSFTDGPAANHRVRSRRDDDAANGASSSSSSASSANLLSRLFGCFRTGSSSYQPLAPDLSTAEHRADRPKNHSPASISSSEEHHTGLTPGPARRSVPPFQIYGGANSLRLLNQQKHLAWPVRCLFSLGSRATGAWASGAEVRPAECAGNGALMRIATTIIPHLLLSTACKAGSSPSSTGSGFRSAGTPNPNLLSELLSDVVLSTQVCHPSSFAMASSLAFCTMLLELAAYRLNKQPLPERFFLNTMARIMQQAETDETYHLHGQARAEHVPGVSPAVAANWAAAARLPSEFLIAKPERQHSREPASQAIYHASVARALDESALPGSDYDLEPTRVAAVLDRWQSNSYLGATLPSVVYLLERYGYRDPAEAVIMAGLVCKDNDTCAAIVGAAMGAYHGSAWQKEVRPAGSSDDLIVKHHNAQGQPRFNVGHGNFPVTALCEHIHDFAQGRLAHASQSSAAQS